MVAGTEPNGHSQRMRSFLAVLVMGLALAGCAQVDRIADRFAAREKPLARSEGTPGAKNETVAACTFPWSRDVPDVTRHDLRIGPVIFRGLATPSEPWWYERGAVVAERLRRGAYKAWSREDARDIAGEILANGPEKFVAQDVLIDVPAATTVEIGVPEDDVNVAILPNGVARFGGFVPADGVKRVRCQAKQATSFHLGFVVAGPRCVSLVARTDQREESSLVGFGTRRCPRTTEALR